MTHTHKDTHKHIGKCKKNLFFYKIKNFIFEYYDKCNILKIFNCYAY